MTHTPDLTIALLALTGLVLELQADALNRGVSCADLLRKALVVSRKLCVEKIEEWLKHELNGYHMDDENIPKYREVQGQIKAWNPYHGWIPLNFGDVQMAEQLSKKGLCNPLGS